jgi:ATP-dependent RNA helicase RhlE
VATDIAARGIDIDDLPHVVNYEIPNIPEDYVHRIGRTGRAGAEGQAVSFVCLDEEGFMQEIERFTKQRIPVQVIEGFGPEAGERAEPIAMGRQTLWGGAGKAPSRDVMAAAAKAARQEMVQRIRENKAGQGERGAKKDKPAHPPKQPQQQKARPPRHNGHVNGNGNGQQRHQQQRDPGEERDDDRMPRNVDPLRTSLPTRRDMTGVKRVNGGGQPDPTRTSVDSMGASKRERNRQRPPAFRGPR